MRGAMSLLVDTVRPLAERKATMLSLPFHLSQGVGDGFADAVVLLDGHLGEEGECQAFATDAFGDGKIARLVAEVGVGLLQVDGDWVVQTGLHTAFLEESAEAIA